MITSDILDRFQASPISVIFAAVQRLRREGRELFDFSVGEPNFDTPLHILEAGKRAIDQGLTRYTPSDGSIGLREAVRRKFLHENSLDYPLAQIVAGMGFECDPYFRLSIATSDATLTRGIKLIAKACAALVKKGSEQWPSPSRISSAA
jgi:aspartate/methionine/tyrosine aminotransferase